MSDARRQLFRIFVRPVLSLVARIFYDPRFLQGRFFEQSLGGWIWVVRGMWSQKLLGMNRHVPWPVDSRNIVLSAANLEFHPDDLNNFQTFGCYFQNRDARIRLGRGTYIAPNVGLITANHDPLDPTRHLPGQDITIGAGCWIGMNSVILPGVELGPRTTVGAGSVVTRSFPSGNCIIAGVPARVIRELASDTHGEADASDRASISPVVQPPA